MKRDRLVRIVVLAAVVATLTVCLGIAGPRGSVVLYGRAAPADEEAVGFGSDGVACLDGPPGGEVVWYDAAPGDRRRPKRVIGRIPADGRPLVLSVEVQADGSLVVGQGVPAWWVGDPHAC